MTEGADPRLARCRRDPQRFALLLLEVALLVLCVRQFKLGEIVGDAFLRTCLLGAGGFALHYWLPLRWKERGFVALGIAGAFVVLGAQCAALLIVVALVFYSIGAARIPYAFRILGFVAVGGALTLGRIALPPQWPAQFWPIVGSVFGFRLLIWAYDVRHMAGRPPFRDYLAYFFMLPNWGCLLFPVVDYHTQRKSFLARDIHDVAQQGVKWMARGVVQLLIYDFVYYRKPAADPATVTSLAQLLLVMVTTYLLYLRLSGTFHFVVGMLHLFGYDLPETHRRWLLASSLADFWRRINVYWKDFMVKLVYLPLWFRLRRRGEHFAQVVATLGVFVATFALHSWQSFWLTGRWRWSGPDALFWGVLALLVAVNLEWESRARAREFIATSSLVIATPSLAVAKPSLARRALQIAATFALVTVLWSMWNAQSLRQWLDLVTFWKPGV
jgi:hypothetical protein